MRHIIIATHYNFAEGLKSTVEFLTSVNNIQVICAYVDKDVKLEDQIKLIFSKVNNDDEVFVFTDLMGGSVNQGFIPYINDKFHLISGINLPLVMTIALQGEELLTEDEIENIIEEAKGQIIYMNKYSFEENDDDE